MFGSLGIWAAAIKYGLIAVVAGGATWYALNTIQRAHEADVLEATLDKERAITKSKAEFDKKIDDIRQSFEGRLDEFATRLETVGAQRRERIIEKLPANSRTCLPADIVRLLNGNAGSGDGLPAPSRGAHDGGQAVARSAGTGLR